MISRSSIEGVAVMQIDNGKANALDLDLLQGLAIELSEVSVASRALVLTGTGPMFSAGIDLPKLLSHGSEYTFQVVEALNVLLETFIDLPIPTVAAINGHAIAGGFVIASACDVRLMSLGTAKLGVTELLVGVPFPPLALEVVRAAVGDQVARRMVLHGVLYTDQQAAAHGLVDELTEPSLLLDRAVEIASDLGRVPGKTFELTKRQLVTPLRLRLEHLGDRHETAVRESWVATETVEGIERFIRERLS